MQKRAGLGYIGNRENPRRRVLVVVFIDGWSLVRTA
jgi:hypothetical protein